MDLKISVFVLFLVFGAKNVLGQKSCKVNGTVRDSLSERQLSLATVEVKSKDGQKDTVIQTDKNGKFMVELPFVVGPYYVEITFIGYKTKKIYFDCKDSVFLKISLHPDIMVLNAIDIKSMKQFITNKIDRTVVSISGSPLSNVGNAFTLIQMLPGLATLQDGSISLLGKNVDLWIDGRPSKLSGNQLKNYLEGLSTNSVDKVELISNPSAAFDGQTAAVVNIVTKRSKDEGLSGNVNIVLGKGKYFREYPSFNVNYRKKKLNFFLNYNFQNTKEKIETFSNRNVGNYLLTQNINTEESLLRTFKSQNVKIGADIYITKNSFLELTAFGIFNNTKENTSNTTRFLSGSAKIDSSSNTSSINKIQYNNPSINLFFKSKIDSIGKTFEVNLDYWSTNPNDYHEYTNSYFDYNGNNNKDNVIFKTTLSGNNNLYSAKLDLTLPNKIGKFSTGAKTYLVERNNNFNWYNYQNGSYNSDMNKSNEFIYHENVDAVYLGWEGQLNKIDFQASARAEYTNITETSVFSSTIFDNKYLNLFPSAILKYPLSARSDIKFAYRKTITRPAFTNLDPFIKYENQYNYSQGNPFLRPEISNFLELSYSLNRQLFATFSYSKVSNALTKVYSKSSTQDSLISTYDNLGKSQKLGLNISYNKLIRNKWLISCSTNLFYNLINTVFQNDKIVNNGKGLNLFFFNSYSLPKDFSLDSFIAYSSVYHGTIFTYDASGYISFGAHKSIWRKRATINLFFSEPFYNSRIGYSTNFNMVNLSYKSFQDSRFLNLSIFYKINSRSSKENIQRSSGIDSEKSRLINQSN